MYCISQLHQISSQRNQNNSNATIPNPISRRTVCFVNDPSAVQKQQQKSSKHRTTGHDPPHYLMALTRPQSEGFGRFLSLLSLSIPGRSRHVVLRITICPRESCVYASISFMRTWPPIVEYVFSPSRSSPERQSVAGMSMLHYIRRTGGGESLFSGLSQGIFYNNLGSRFLFAGNRECYLLSWWNCIR